MAFHQLLGPVSVIVDDPVGTSLHRALRPRLAPTGFARVLAHSAASVFQISQVSGE